MNKRNAKGQQLSALLCVVGCLLFNYPLLFLFNDNGFIGGMPILYVYIFMAWGVLIGLMAIVVEYYR